MNLRLRPLAAASLLALLAGPAAAQELRIAMKAAVDNPDPHQNYTPNRNVQLHVYETLVAQDEHLRPRPGLAESWTSPDPNTWEFTLREGVRFHDGTPLTPEDVAFSLARAGTVQGVRTYASNVRNVVSVEARGPRTVVVRTREPTPQQPGLLAGVAILSARAARDATGEDFNGGRAAQGTGPYRWVRWTANQDVVLERAPAHWGAAEPWTRVTYRFIPNDSARTAALLAGDVDVIDTVPPGLYERVRSSGRHQVIATDSIFTHYLYLDSMSERIANATGADGQPLPRNPLRDHRVRQAMTHALNRTVLAERAMEGGATPAGQVAAEGFQGHVPGMAPPAFDPALSRRLLAEAGYPGGFNLTLNCTNDRFAGDARTCQGVAGMLNAVGIRATVDAQPLSVYFRRWSNIGPNGSSELSAHMSMFGSSTGLANEALTTLVRTPNPARGQGVTNRNFHSDPELDRRLEAVDRSFDEAERERLTQEAVRYAVDRQALVPLFFMRASWGVRRELVLEPRGDGYTMATAIRRAP